MKENKYKINLDSGIWATFASTLTLAVSRILYTGDNVLWYVVAGSAGALGGLGIDYILKQVANKDDFEETIPDWELFNEGDSFLDIPEQVKDGLLSKKNRRNNQIMPVNDDQIEIFYDYMEKVDPQENQEENGLKLLRMGLMSIVSGIITYKSLEFLGIDFLNVPVSFLIAAAAGGFSACILEFTNNLIIRTNTAKNGSVPFDNASE